MMFVLVLLIASFSLGWAASKTLRIIQEKNWKEMRKE